MSGSSVRAAAGVSQQSIPTLGTADITNVSAQRIFLANIMAPRNNFYCTLTTHWFGPNRQQRTRLFPIRQRIRPEIDWWRPWAEPPRLAGSM